MPTHGARLLRRASRNSSSADPRGCRAHPCRRKTTRRRPAKAMRISALGASPNCNWRLACCIHCGANWRTVACCCAVPPRKRARSVLPFIQSLPSGVIARVRPPLRDMKGCARLNSEGRIRSMQKCFGLLMKTPQPLKVRLCRRRSSHRGARRGAPSARAEADQVIRPPTEPGNRANGQSRSWRRNGGGGTGRCAAIERRLLDAA